MESIDIAEKFRENPEAVSVMLLMMWVEKGELRVEDADVIASVLEVDEVTHVLNTALACDYSSRTTLEAIIMTLCFRGKLPADFVCRTVRHHGLE